MFDFAASEDWIFGYGSLMWNPGFSPIEKRPALLYGYHRRFCIYSHSYRGTPECPGLVLGLDRGGACRGVAFRLPRRGRHKVLQYLWEREMTNNIYTPRRVSVMLLDAGRPMRVEARAFVVNRDHERYTGELSVDRTARLILQGVGGRGRCFDYLANTVRHMEELGIAEGPLHELLRRVERMSAAPVGRRRMTGQAKSVARSRPAAGRQRSV
ncbi:MAG: gamma-glutamylcyclotransferase [Alphaproteobacteria bacterium]|nr:gamma-glutamylcyclotransferase [Alphaproteobacteria bacterium]